MFVPSHNNRASNLPSINFTINLATFFMVVSFPAYSSAMKLGLCFSETSVDFQWATLCYIPEYRTQTIHYFLSNTGLTVLEAVVMKVLSSGT
jgi:hypothetical protein